MALGTEPRPPGSAEKSLGEIVADVTQKVQLLIREEIELAKAEVAVKAKKFGIGAGLASASLITVYFFVLFLFVGIALLLNNAFSLALWVCFMIVAVFFLILTAVLVMVGVRLIRKATPAAPQMAIEEAKATKAMLDEARH
jgi:hypothetical protein